MYNQKNVNIVKTLSIIFRKFQLCVKNYFQQSELKKLHEVKLCNYFNSTSSLYIFTLLPGGNSFRQPKNGIRNN